MYEHSARKPDGCSIIFDPAAGGEVHTDTKMCCHCGQHFPYKAGSGRIRGWCTRCNAMTCGKPECHECFPIEQRLDLYEKGWLPSLLSPMSDLKIKVI